MSLLLLGRVALQDRSGRPLTIPGIKARALLALLAGRANRYVPTEQLEDQLWDGTPPPAARSTIQAHVSRLRTVLAASGATASLERRASGYELHVDPNDIDVHRFEVLAADADRLVSGDARLAADVCARALDEWRGPALQDVRHVSALFVEAQRLDELRLATIELRLSAELDVGGHAMAVGPLQRLVDEHPYRERLRALLMLALHRSGRQVEALRTYRAGYRALAEIGVRPGCELRELEMAISREDPALQRLGIAGRPGARRVRSTDVDDGECGHDRPVTLVEGPDPASTVEAIAEAAVRSGRAVLRGTPVVSGGRPYQRIADALAPLLTAGTDPRLLAAMAPIVAAVPPAPGADPAFQRFEAFEAVLAVLSAEAARQPVVVVLDDVDDAGASTLDLIEHIARRRGDAALRLVLARTSSTSDDAPDGAASCARSADARLLALEREGLVHRVTSGQIDAAARPTPGGDGPPSATAPAKLAADAFDHAARLSARAGDDALLRLGFEEAAGHYRAALAALEFTAEPPIVRRAELHLALGRACQSAYQLDCALEGFRQAAAGAIKVGDVHLLGEAAVGVATATEFGMADASTEAVLTAALDILPGDAPARVELLAGLARTVPGHSAAAVQRVRDAVELARRLDTPRPLVVALATSILVTWGPGAARSRLADIDEVIASAGDLDMVELAVEARAWRAATLDQLGRPKEGRRERLIVQQWAEQSRRPFFVALAALLTIADHLRHGRTHAADTALADLPSGAEASPNFAAGFAAQLFVLRRRQRRLGELMPLLEGLAGDAAAPAAWQAARVVALAETGDAAATEALRIAVSRLGEVPEDWLWLATVTLLADACGRVGDRDVADELFRRLSPYRADTVIVAHGVASLGSVAPRLTALRRVVAGAASSTPLPPTAAA